MGWDIRMASNKKCVLCNSKVSEKYTPFCSKRCADLDLGKWFNESYRVEGEDKTSSDNQEGEENQDLQ